MFGSDAESVKFCKTAVEHLEKIIEEYGLLSKTLNEQKIIIELGEGIYPYQIKEEILGEIDLQFYWKQDLELHLFCRGLTEAYLRAWAWANGKSYKSIDRGVLFYAITWALEKELNPDLLREKSPHWREASWKTEVEIWQNNPVLSDLNKATQWAYLCNQYWNYCKQEKSEWIPILTLGRSPLNVSSSQEGKITWRIYFEKQLKSEKNYYIYSIQDSKTWLHENSYFEKDSKRIHLEMIWLYREEKSLQILARNRLLKLKLVLNRINPIYYNSILSLGICLETFLEKDRQKFAKALGTFLFDVQIAKEQQTAIEKILSETEGIPFYK